MPRKLTLDELARQTEMPTATLTQWRALGLIGYEDEASFGEDDLQRVRLIGLLLRRGVNLDTLVQVERTEPFLGRYLEYLSEQGERGATYSLEQLAERVGMDHRIVQRFVEASGLVGPEAKFSDDDIKLLAGMKVILESSLPEDALVQLLRVYSEALGRVAEAEVKVFHFYVHERLRAEGVAAPDLPAMTDAARTRMMPFRRADHPLLSPQRVCACDTRRRRASSPTRHWTPRPSRAAPASDCLRQPLELHAARGGHGG